jgi:hypothetical protein
MYGLLIILIILILLLLFSKSSNEYFTNTLAYPKTVSENTIKYINSEDQNLILSEAQHKQIILEENMKNINNQIITSESQLNSDNTNLQTAQINLNKASQNYLLVPKNLAFLAQLQVAQQKYNNALQQVNKTKTTITNLNSQYNTDKTMLADAEFNVFTYSPNSPAQCRKDDCNKVLNHKYNKGIQYQSNDYPICNACNNVFYPYRVGDTSYPYIKNTSIDTTSVNAIKSEIDPSIDNKECQVIHYDSGSKSVDMLCKNNSVRTENNMILSKLPIGACSKPYTFSNNNGIPSCNIPGFILSAGQMMWSSNKMYALKLELNGFLTIYTTQNLPTTCVMPKTGVFNDIIGAATTVITLGSTIGTINGDKSYNLFKTGALMSTFFPKSPFNNAVFVALHPPPYTLILQYDGNLVIRDNNNLAAWFSGRTMSIGIKTVPPYKLVLQDDGNLITFDANKIPVWGTGRFNDFKHLCKSFYPVHIYGYYYGNPQIM